MIDQGWDSRKVCSGDSKNEKERKNLVSYEEDAFNGERRNQGKKEEEYCSHNNLIGGWVGSRLKVPECLKIELQTEFRDAERAACWLWGSSSHPSM